MRKSLLYMLLLAMSLGSNLHAEEDGEHMEVTAPNECCQIPLPGSLGMLAGWVGASGAAAGSAALRDVALRAAAERATQQRAQQGQQTPQQENTQYNDATQNKDSAKQSNVWDFLINLTNKLLDGGSRSDSVFTTKNTDGSVTEGELHECKAGGPLNPNNTPCTEHKFELFVDPTDGIEKWAYTMAVVEPKYNPKHYDAEPSGYYPAVVGNQSFTIVFQTKEDLLWQLQRIGGRH